MEPSTPTLEGRRAALIQELEAIRDPQSRLGWVVNQARHRPPLAPERRLDAHLVAGCKVRIWWIASIEDGRCRFETDSDAVTLKAMAGLVADVCNGAALGEIAATDFNFLERLGLLRQLAESRQATVLRIVELAREFATGRKVDQAASASTGS